MSKVILYTAVSLDGFIARPDGDLDWLDSIPNPKEGDYGYQEILTNIHTIVMGRKTYDKVISFGIDWPYPNFDSYVVTRDKNFKPTTGSTYRLTSGLKDFVAETKRKSKKNIWLVGGGQLNTAFLNQGLLDRMILSVIPKMIGEGIPLFASKPAETNWKLINVQHFETGVVNLVYDKL